MSSTSFQTFGFLILILVFFVFTVTCWCFEPRIRRLLHPGLQTAGRNLPTSENVDYDLLEKPVLWEPRWVAGDTEKWQDVMPLSVITAEPSPPPSKSKKKKESITAPREVHIVVMVAMPGQEAEYTLGVSDTLTPEN